MGYKLRDKVITYLDDEGIKQEGVIIYNNACTKFLIVRDIRTKSLRHISVSSILSISDIAEHKLASKTTTLCDCGAKHTSNPNFHLSMCSTLK